MEKELQATKIVLAETTMVVDALEILIEKANHYYETDVKKINPIFAYWKQGDYFVVRTGMI
ncbi:MAG: hypothetical protein LBE04_00145 [Prevotellaceae bacterium]|nr:hypothetical protein [Prevotellaceae bacterium]